jgi:hypothetical protein
MQPPVPVPKDTDKHDGGVSGIPHEADRVKNKLEIDLTEDISGQIKSKILKLSEATKPARKEQLYKELEGSLAELARNYGIKPVIAHEFVHEFMEQELSKAAREVLPSGGQPDVLKLFNTNMQRFEARVAKGEIDHLEAAKSYAQLERLLKSNGTESCTSEQLKLMARQLLHMAAEPTHVEQGGHGTCTVAALQVRTLSLYPSDVFRVVADVALTGKTTALDGTLIEPDKASIRPDSESKLYPTPDGKRCYASQIFQVAAVNLFWMRQTTVPDHLALPQDLAGKRSSSIKQGDICYGQDETVANATGEWLKIKTDSGWRKIADYPMLLHDEIAGLSTQITGRTEPVLVAHTSTGFRSHPGVFDVQNEKNLHSLLSNLAKGNTFLIENSQVKGKLPIIVVVNLSNEPFKSEYGYVVSDPNNWHAMTIVGYEPNSKDPARSLISLDNTHRRGLDHTGLPGTLPKLNLEQLIQAMEKPNGS